MFYIVLAKTKNVNKIRETAMRKNTKQTMLFKEISGKKVEVDFNGGDVSSDAGLLFLRETESQIGVINKVANAINVFFKSPPVMTMQMILMILGMTLF
jgi:hypothetical protein